MTMVASRVKCSIQWTLAIVVASSLSGMGCSDESPSAAENAVRPQPRPAASEPAVQTPRSEAQLIEAGRGVYNANCISCHAVDPAKDGALGPAVAGSSLELLEARVVGGGYPEGYTPKRATRVMVALPHLEPRLEELAAYLGSL